MWVSDKLSGGRSQELESSETGLIHKLGTWERDTIYVDF